MSRKTPPTRSARMQLVSRRIEHWRATRAHRGRMPEPLWEAAVALARKHGLYATVQGLRVSYGSLKARVDGSEPKRGASKARAAAFVELSPGLPLGPVPPPGPVIELARADGQKLTLRLTGADELDLARLVREFWSRRA